MSSNLKKVRSSILTAFHIVIWAAAVSREAPTLKLRETPLTKSSLSNPVRAGSTAYKARAEMDTAVRPSYPPSNSEPRRRRIPGRPTKEPCGA